VLLLQLQLSHVYVGAVPEDTAEGAAAATEEEGLQLLALQVMLLLLLSLSITYRFVQLLLMSAPQLLSAIAVLDLVIAAAVHASITQQSMHQLPSR
jgi:hypothetical protein